MSHKNKIPLARQPYIVLQSKAAFGRSKHADKMNGDISSYIYSFNSMKTYIRLSTRFVQFCHEDEFITSILGHKAQTLEECKPFIQYYFDSHLFSAATEQTCLSALKKLYGEELDAVAKVARRCDITRSRLEAERDKHFSEEENWDLVNVCRCVGFRRMELEKCKSGDLFIKDGYYYVHIIGKGGRPRDAMIIGNEEEVYNAIVYIKCLTGCNHVHSCADIHSYRADYCTRAYLSKAKPISELRGKKINYTEITGKRKKDGSVITKPAVYYCRKDKASIAYDRAAMIFASRMLGHNREDVVAEHYLYKLCPADIPEKE